MITANSKPNAGSYDLQLGIVEDKIWLWPSWCCKPSPLRVVLPEVAPIKKPFACASPAAQAKSWILWNPNIE